MRISNLGRIVYKRLIKTVREAGRKVSGGEEKRGGGDDSGIETIPSKFSTS